MNSKGMKAVLCRNCHRLLGYYHVVVGELKCGRCNHVAEYHVLTESFIHQVQEQGDYDPAHDHSSSKHIALA